MTTEQEDTAVDDTALFDHFKDVGASAPEDAVWIVDKVIPRGLTIIASPPKAWKSTILNMLATLVAGYKHKGLPDDLSDVVKPGLVLGLSGEATAGEINYMAKDGFKCTIEPNGTFLVSDAVWEWRLDVPAQKAKLLRVLNEHKPRLLFIDPLRNFHTQREDDSGVMIEMLAPLRKWAVDNNAAVVVVHHTRKQNKDDKKQVKQKLTPDDLRGSSALFGMCDGLMIVTRNENIVTLDTVYKRGASWCRDVALSVWKEEVNERMKAAVKFHKVDGYTYDQICEAFHISRNTFSKWIKLVGDNFR